MNWQNTKIIQKLKSGATILFPILLLTASGCTTTASNTTCIQPGDLVDVMIPPAPPKAARTNSRLAKDFVELQSAVMVDNEQKEKLRKVLATCREV